jgi:hypothetical protein
VIPDQFACFPTALARSERAALQNELHAIALPGWWKSYRRWIYDLVVKQQEDFPVVFSVFWHAIHMGSWLGIIFNRHLASSLDPHPRFELLGVCVSFLVLHTLIGILYVLIEGDRDPKKSFVLGLKSFIPGFRPLVILLSLPLRPANGFKTYLDHEPRVNEIRWELGNSSDTALARAVYTSLLNSMRQDLQAPTSFLQRLRNALSKEIDYCAAQKKELDNGARINVNGKHYQEIFAPMQSAAQERLDRLRGIHLDVAQREKEGEKALEVCTCTLWKLADLVEIGRADRCPGDPVSVDEPIWTKAAEESARQLLDILWNAYRDFRWAIDPDILEGFAKFVRPEELAKAARED